MQTKISDNAKPLKILNASAGSGKTYSLVKTYIKLLLFDQNNASKFSEIIAMTFTNKAALEMKQRIIEKLDELSHPEVYPNVSQNYAIEIGEEIQISSEEVHQRARLVLESILHRYEDFHVMTIDKFNLRLIRSFSLDLDLPNDFEVILNEDAIIEQVIDQLLEMNGKDDELSKLIFNYANSLAEDDQTWNIRRSLVDFAKILKQESNFPMIERLQSLEFTLDEFNALKQEQRLFVNEFLTKCKEVHDQFLKHNLSSTELPGGIHTYNPIDRLISYNQFPKDLFTDSFLKKCSEEAPKGKLFPMDLRESLVALNAYFLKSVEKNEQYDKYLKNYFNMSLLKYISQALLDLRTDERLIRISEFNKMISELVSEDDAPYIYERMGTRYRHFMLDEFQDTSRLQWMNMTPLVHESLGSNKENLIVGDPKQSIYRFKNGVAQQFVDLPGLYNPEQNEQIELRSQFFKSMGVVSNLDSNWRSSKTIVDFNNQLFELIREKTPDVYRDYYKSVHQIAKSSKNGFVSITSKKVTKNSDLMDYVPFILESIEACESAGFKRGEICILGERNKDCTIWANALTQANYQVVSADSLLVDNEPKVKMMLSYLKLRLNPNSQNENKQFAEHFFRNSSLSVAVYRSYFVSKKREDLTEYTYFDSDAFIGEYFQSKLKFLFKFESLYDLIQQSYSLFRFNELDNPYLHHFADMVHSYELRFGPDLKLFLNDFESNSSGKAVQIPESDDALKIMTIHKSKGLEFPVVIIPAMNGLTDGSKSSFFVESNPFLIYTKLSGSSAIDAVKKFTNMENEQNLMDKINLFYVALTRPIERLYINNWYSGNSFGSLFHDALSKMPEALSESEEITLRLGSEHRSETIGKHQEDQFFVPVNSLDNLWFPEIALQDRNELLTEQILSDEQRFGNQFHLAISKINFKDEIESVVHSMVQTGEIETENQTKMIKSLNALFESEAYISLFSGALKIFNEQSFIISKSEQLRPDKIIVKENETYVVDYKTGLPKAKDKKQVTLYTQVMQEVGYTNVKGFLFYTNENSLVHVSG